MTLAAVATTSPALEDSIVIFPNPGEKTLFLKGLEHEDFVEVFNAKGKLMVSGFGLSLINMAPFAKGIYFIRVNNYPIGKWIKQG